MYVYIYILDLRHEASSQSARGRQRRGKHVEKLIDFFVANRIDWGRRFGYHGVAEAKLFQPAKAYQSAQGIQIEAARAPRAIWTSKTSRQGAQGRFGMPKRAGWARRGDSGAKLSNQGGFVDRAMLFETSQGVQAGRAGAIRGTKTSRQSAQIRFGKPKRAGRARRGDSGNEIEQAGRFVDRAMLFEASQGGFVDRPMLFEPLDRSSQCDLSTGPCFSRPPRADLSTGPCFSSLRGSQARSQLVAG